MASVAAAAAAADELRFLNRLMTATLWQTAGGSMLIMGNRSWVSGSKKRFSLVVRCNQFG